MRTKLTILLLSVLAVVGCVPPGFDDPEGIVLDIVVADSQTRATKEGVEALNENVVNNKLDIFFYNLSTGKITKEALQALMVGERVQLSTNPNDIETIFGTQASGAKCGIFVVANFAGSYKGTSGNRYIDSITSSLLPGPTWDVYDEPNEVWRSTQSSFVMTGQDTVVLRNAGGSTPVHHTVSLARVAAKVTFDVTVSNNLNTGEEHVWTPDTNNMSVYMVYAMRQATLGATPVPVPATANDTYSGGTIVLNQYKDRVLYPSGTTKPRNRKDEHDQTVSVNLPVYTTDHNNELFPFYTYPVSWEIGSSMEPYMKLIIPWTYGNTTRKYYYKIPFHDDALLRNHWYHISIDVQILGTEQAEPPEVTITYAVGPWSGTMDDTAAGDYTNPASVPATVITAKYLNVPTTEYVLYNEDQLVIPIQSSSDVEVVGFTVASNAYSAAHDVEGNYVGTDPRIYNPFTTTLNPNGKIVAVRPDYSATDPSPVSHEFTYNQAADSENWSVSVSNDRTAVTLTHTMNRDMSTSNYDVAPYTIRMRLRHKGDGASLYFTDVTVEQRPSIIIKPEANSGGTANYGYGFVNGGQGGGANNNNSDGSYTSSSTQSRWEYYLGSSPSNLSNASNTNTNMYVIETSVLPTTGTVANYMLGDPRSRSIDNLGQSWSQSKASVQGGNRRITYYYPVGGAEYSNFIAPKFRIASSFGATQPTSYDNAKRRCASYQEDGYPAGRWRLPTVAEITYMAQLTTDGLIPRLLGGSTGSGTTDYWSNNGYVTVADGTNTAAPVSNTGTSSTRYVRCVYDEWYWEDTLHEKVTKTTFTWGDEPRSDVRKK